MGEMCSIGAGPLCLTVLVPEAATSLSRQHLDGGFPGGFPDLVEQLAGINAQTPRAPYVAVWTRMGDYDRALLDEVFTSNRLVRANVMRGTIHALTPRQYAMWWPALQPTLRRVVDGFCKGFTARVDVQHLVDEAVNVLDARGALGRRELGAELAGSFPDSTSQELGFAARLLAPIVQTGDSVNWNGNRPTYVPFESVTDLKLCAAAEGRRDLARSFAAAFGVNNPADFAYWSGMTVREARQEQSTLDEAIAGDRAVAVPRKAYVLPEFDNLFFAQKQAVPFTPADAKKRLIFGAAEMKGCIIMDQRVVGEWRRQRGGDRPDLTYWEPESLQMRAEWRRFAGWYEGT